MSAPEVSVIIPTYNRAHLIARAVDCVLQQTYPHCHVIVVDDGSTDATPAILSEYARADSRLVIHRQPNQGRTSALNVGFALARAPLVARLDADDVAVPGRLERQRAFLESHADYALVGGGATFIDENGSAFADVVYPTADGEIRAAFAHTTPFIHSAVMLRKTAFSAVGGYRHAFSQAEDLDLWLRIAELHRVANLPECVVRYRMHAGQASVQQSSLQVLGALAARLSARARATGVADPVDTMKRVDIATLITHGITREEITTSSVLTLIWLARTMSRAGASELADRLLEAASAEARSNATVGRALAANVHRERARRYAEEGRWFKSGLETLRAISSRSSTGRSRTRSA
jgi:hypothetical protein